MFSTVQPATCVRFPSEVFDTSATILRSVLVKFYVVASVSINTLFITAKIYLYSQHINRIICIFPGESTQEVNGVNTKMKMR